MAKTEAPKPETAASTAPRWFRQVVLFTALIAMTFAWGVVLRARAPFTANDASRWDTVWSLVERGTYAIDEAPWPTIDKVFRDGHFYSTKPALFPTLVAGEYWLLRRLTGCTLEQRGMPIVRAVVITFNLLPLGLYIWLTGLWLEANVRDSWWRLFWLMAAAFGTYVTGYCGTLTNHTVAAFAALYALYCVLRIVHEGRREPRYFALAGLCTGLMANFDLISVLWGLIVLGWLLRVDARRTALYFVPLGALPIAAFFVTNLFHTGSWLPYHRMFFPEYYEYPGSAWHPRPGTEPRPRPKTLYVFNILVGHHGIFLLTPVFLLSFLGMGLGLRRQTGAYRLFNLLVLGTTVLTMVYYVTQTTSYGGWCQGFRWLMWMTPLWLLGGATTTEVYGRSWAVKSLGVVFLVWSITSAVYALPMPWAKPWILLGGWVGH